MAAAARFFYNIEGYIYFHICFIFFSFHFRSPMIIKYICDIYNLFAGKYISRTLKYVKYIFANTSYFYIENILKIYFIYFDIYVTYMLFHVGFCHIFIFVSVSTRNCEISSSLDPICFIIRPALIYSTS